MVFIKIKKKFCEYNFSLKIENNSTFFNYGVLQVVTVLDFCLEFYKLSETTAKVIV